MARTPGLIALFGSGETSADGQRGHTFVMRQVTPPIRACVLETPAGFELNSPLVAGKIAEFLRTRLQNFHPEVAVIPARRRGTPESPDNPEVVAPLLRSNYIMMGPGSPTYAIRQLKDSLAWHTLLARHRLGYPLVFASAVAIAVGAYALPVYEVYKVGEDIHWNRGLDLLGPYGVSVAFVPHWNNNEGGEDLDTSRCYMGVPRFERLLEMLPREVTVVGIDERTALIIDFAAGRCRVLGHGGVTCIRDGAARRLDRNETLDLSALGVTRLPEPSEGIPPEVWERALAEEGALAPPVEPTPVVVELARVRSAARASRDWVTADRLRKEIASQGWQVKDTREGYELLPRAATSDGKLS